MSLLQSSTPLTGQTGHSVKIDKLKKKKKKDKDDGNGKKPLPDLAMMKNGHGIAYKGELCGGKVDSVVCADGCHCDLDKSKKFFGEHVGNCIGTCPSRQEINAAANIIEIVYSDGSHETHNLDKAGIGYYDYQSQDLYGVPHFVWSSATRTWLFATDLRRNACFNCGGYDGICLCLCHLQWDCGFWLCWMLFIR
eukprot:138516_1